MFIIAGVQHRDHLCVDKGMSRCDRVWLVSDQVSSGTGKIGKGELQWSREGARRTRGGAEAGESWEQATGLRTR